MKQTGKYPEFVHWSEGYCALTYTYRDKAMIVNYIKNQKKHHKHVAFEDEYKDLLEENGVEFDERYIF